MRFGWIVLLLLSFPVLEAIGIFWMAGHFGAWVLLWLLLAALGGIALIRFERVAWGARLLFSVQSGTHPFAALFASGRMLIAGGLLVFPGFISDAIALGLLLVPGTWRRPVAARPPANDDVPPAPQAAPAREAEADVMPTTIEGEYRRVPDERLR
jgi:UPF0716 protein FxsA